MLQLVVLCFSALLGLPNNKMVSHIIVPDTWPESFERFFSYVLYDFWKILVQIKLRLVPCQHAGFSKLMATNSSFWHLHVGQLL